MKVVRSILWFAKLFAIAYVSVTLGTMHFRHGYHDGRIMRCWSIMLPGYSQHVEWDDCIEPRVSESFRLFSPYRLGPWIEVESP